MADVDRLQCFDCRIAPGSRANRNLASLVVQPIIAGTKYGGEPRGGAPAVRGGDRVPDTALVFSARYGPRLQIRQGTQKELAGSQVHDLRAIRRDGDHRTKRTSCSLRTGNHDLNSTVGDTRFHPA